MQLSKPQDVTMSPSSEAPDRTLLSRASSRVVQLFKSSPKDISQFSDYEPGLYDEATRLALYLQENDGLPLVADEIQETRSLKEMIQVLYEAKVKVRIRNLFSKN